MLWAFRHLLWTHSCIVYFVFGNLSNGVYHPNSESSELYTLGRLSSHGTWVAVEVRTAQQAESRLDEKSNENADVRMCGNMGHCHRIEPKDEGIRLLDGSDSK